MGIFLSWLILSIIVACIASSKGRSGFGWFCLSMLISPLISIIILLCVGDSQDKKEADLQTAMDIIERRKSNSWLPENEDDDSMSQEKAINELKKAKDLLDLGIISQEEYETKKEELLPFLRDDYLSQEAVPEIVEEPIAIADDIQQDAEKSTTNIEDKPIEYRWYQKTWIQALIVSLIPLILIIICLVGFFISSSSNTNKPKNAQTTTMSIAKPLPHAKTKKHSNKQFGELKDSQDSEIISFTNSDKKIVEQFISLYNELLKFKNESEFILIGFDPDGKYYNWLKKVHQFETKANGDVLIKLSIVPNDLESLGMEYVISHGNESEVTQFFRNTIDEAIRQYKESQNTTPIKK